MKLSAATLLLFLVSVVLVAAGLLGHFRPDLMAPEIVDNRFWLVAAGWGVLAFGVLLKSS